MPNRLKYFAGLILSALLVTASAEAQVLTEVHVGSDDFVTILNPTGSGIDLGDYTLRIRSSTQGPIDFSLPPGILEPGASISVTDTPVMPGVDIDVGVNLLWTGGSDVSIALLGPIGETRDFVAVGSTVQAPPTGISFSPGAVSLALLDDQTQSVVRTSFNGSAPTFLQIDWTIGLKTGPAGGTLTPVEAVPLADELARALLALALIGAGTLSAGRKSIAAPTRF